MNKEIKIEKKFEFFLGLFFLIPPFLGVFFFIFNLFDWADGWIVEMRYLGGEWEAHYGDGGGATPPAPIYLGLMAIAGVLLVKNSLRYLVCKDEDTPTTNNIPQEIQLTETHQSPIDSSTIAAENNTKEIQVTEDEQASQAPCTITEENNINEALGLK